MVSPWLVAAWAWRPSERLLVTQGLEHIGTAGSQGQTLAQSWCEVAPRLAPSISGGLSLGVWEGMSPPPNAPKCTGNVEKPSKPPQSCRPESYRSSVPCSVRGSA